MIKGDLARRMEQLLAERVPFVTATVVRAMSPTSVRPGDSALVLADGTIEGFVGGVCAKSSVRLHAVRVLETAEPVVLRLEPGAGDETIEDGMVVAHNPCLSGGTMEIFLEPQLPAARIVVAGDTPIARALTQIATAAGYDVHAGDPSPGDAAVVVAAHGDNEERILSAALEAGVGYVALVASETRGAAVRESLNVPDALREQLHTPAGLAIGARTPAEIAIAILAEIVATRVGAPGPIAPSATAPSAPAPSAPAPSAPAPSVIAMPGQAATAPSVIAMPGQAASPPPTAVDPICGMTVLAVEATVHADLEGERFYFCCEGCRDTYLERHAVAP